MYDHRAGTVLWQPRQATSCFTTMSRLRPIWIIQSAGLSLEVARRLMNFYKIMRCREQARKPEAAYRAPTTLTAGWDRSARAPAPASPPRTALSKLFVKVHQPALHRFSERYLIVRRRALPAGH